MKNPIKLHVYATPGGEILTQPATFLPVKPGRPAAGEEILPPKVLDLGCFLPVLNLTRKNLTVAQPLLKGDLQ